MGSFIQYVWRVVSGKCEYMVGFLASRSYILIYQNGDVIDHRGEIKINLFSC